MFNFDKLVAFTFVDLRIFGTRLNIDIEKQVKGARYINKTLLNKFNIIFSFFKCAIKKDKFQENILKYACLGNKGYGIKNTKFIVTTLHQRSCMFEDTNLQRCWNDLFLCIDYM